MIVNNNAAKLESNVEPTKALNFGISDVRLVVDILSKLYAYPIRTLVQEYICNGRDAMREAGTWGKVPMTIQVPTTFEPTFKVRDFGVGISPDRMENIFVNYGSSTKRNTNTQTGGFGIGAKSAFSYTDSFIVTSFVGGFKYIYMAHLGDQGGVNLLEKVPSSEPTGVEIAIGVKPKDIHEFRDAVQRCVRYWSEKINFVGSSAIQQLKPTNTLGNMNLYYQVGSQHKTIYLIDGIEYPLLEKTNKWGYTDTDNLAASGHTITINLPNGYFKIASSRERIENNDENKQKQDARLKECEKFIDMVITTKINDMNLSLEERLKNKLAYDGFKKVSYASLDLGDGVSFNGTDLRFSNKVIPYRYCKISRRSRNKQFLTDKISGVSTLNTVIHNGDDSIQSVRKLNYYLDSNPTVRLVSKDDISTVKYWDSIFTKVLDVATLPMPPKKAQVLKQRSTTGAICWSINEYGNKNQWTIEKLNRCSEPVVFVDDIDDKAKAISVFLDVIMVPKSNKDLVLKKGMTIEQGNEYLYSKHKEEVVGLDSILPLEFKKVKVLKHLKRRIAMNDITQYLWIVYPDLKKEHENMVKEFNDIVTKYPLIKVMNSLDRYNMKDSLKIVIDEINKQSKEN